MKDVKKVLKQTINNNKIKKYDNNLTIIINIKQSYV